MEFLVEFEVKAPGRTPVSEVKDREAAEAAAARTLAEEGHLVRVWRREGKVLGLYRAHGRSELDGLLGSLPLRDWMQVAVTPLEAHPNDPAAAEFDVSSRLPDPRLTHDGDRRGCF